MRIETKSIAFIPPNVAGSLESKEQLDSYLNDGWEYVGFSMATQYYGYILLKRVIK
jgi:hypothetical protein